MKNGLIAAEEILRINKKSKIIIMSADKTIKDRVLTIGVIFPFGKKFLTSI